MQIALPVLFIGNFERIAAGGALKKAREPGMLALSVVADLGISLQLVLAAWPELCGIKPSLLRTDTL